MSNVYRKLTMTRSITGPEAYSKECLDSVSDYLFKCDLSSMKESIDLIAKPDSTLILSWNDDQIYIELIFDKHGYHKLQTSLVKSNCSKRFVSTTEFKKVLKEGQPSFDSIPVIKK